LKLATPFIGSCFGHVMSKATQYAIDNSKLCSGFIKVHLKETRVVLQKTITWTKKFVKGLQEWKKACICVGLATRKLKALVKTFGNTLCFACDIFLKDFTIYGCYLNMLWVVGCSSFIFKSAY
jgi:hypothetical protein